MTDILRRRKYDCSLEEARKKVEKIYQDLQSKIKLTGSWAGNDFVLAGTGIKNGRIRLAEGEISVEVKLSLLGRPFRGKADAEIEKTLQREFG
jgi:putative polyhydroxyalkanoate system protein